MSSFDFSGRTAVITGGVRGIASAAAQAISRAGGNVVLAAPGRDAANAAAAAVGGNAVGVAVGAVDQEAARRCVESAIDRFGSVDILVNTSGIDHARGRLVDQDYLRFTKTLGVNLWAPILWTSLAARAWMSEHGGVVINTVGGADSGLYSAAHAALIHVTGQLAAELSPAVRVNTIALGGGRPGLAGATTTPAPSGEPDDTGEIIAHLASDTQRWVTGETLVVDRGASTGLVRAL
ncbi:SDR family oxidoreductase [Nocardia sp. NPDC050413]|uniref:SDR family oxidoreductase n=1 Tax=Nocardia sp. NPDC050413 TaxID=3155784 RepID=UPI0033CCD73E